jgi:transcriptional regulator with PAS, ATPase and Fis domain
MPEGQPFSRETSLPSRDHMAAVTRVSVDDLARVPAQRLARLLLERAAEDPTLLSRLYETVDRGACGCKPGAQTSPAQTSPAQTSAAQSVGAQSVGAQSVGAQSLGAQLIAGASPAMRQIAALLTRFGQTDEPVLITGESGTGKELLARAIHAGSARAQGPFVAVNCAAIPSGLVASELFGHEKGAFTGATARSLGQIELANGGTLFLDEIGDMPIDLQGHLLRFVQEGQIRRVGARDTLTLNVRIVSATNVRLARAIGDGRFREDLYYRLNVLTLPVPPLRDRKEDVAQLAYHFLSIAARDFNRPVEGFTAEAMAGLLRYRWPGNVRELMSVVRRAVIVGDGPLIGMSALLGLDDGPAAPSGPAIAPKPGSAQERTALLGALERTDENITSTAEALNVSRVTLYRMLRRHGIVLKRGLASAPIVRGRAAVSG